MSAAITTFSILVSTAALSSSSTLNNKEWYVQEQVKSWNQPESLTNYLYQANLPAFSEMTFCTWYEGEPPTHTAGGQGFLFSIAAPSYDNAMAFQHGSQTSFYLWGQNHILGDHGLIWKEPHIQCFTWKSGGKVKWFVDEVYEGVPTLKSEIEIGRTTTLPAGGTLVVLMEQDSLGGGFEWVNANHGRVARFNIWNYEMTESEVSALTCADKGNVVNFDTLVVQGTDNFEEITLPRFVENVSVLPAGEGSTQGKSLLVKKIGNYNVTENEKTIMTVANRRSCLKECGRHDNCHSFQFNFNSAVSNCILYIGDGTRLVVAVVEQVNDSTILYSAYDLASPEIGQCTN